MGTNPRRWLVVDAVTVQTGLITALFAMINLALYLAIVSALPFVLWIRQRPQY